MVYCKCEVFYTLKRFSIYGKRGKWVKPARLAHTLWVCDSPLFFICKLQCVRDVCLALIVVCLAVCLCNSTWLTRTQHILRKCTHDVSFLYEDVMLLNTHTETFSRLRTHCKMLAHSHTCSTNYMYWLCYTVHLNHLHTHTHTHTHTSNQREGCLFARDRPTLGCWGECW